MNFCVDTAGFLEAAVAFVLQGAPSVPPQVSAALPSSDTSEWMAYFEREGLPAALKMLAGLCRGHAGAQALLATRGLLERLHWMEGTSTSGEVRRRGFRFYYPSRADSSTCSRLL